MNFIDTHYQKVCTFTRSIQLSQIFTYCLILSQLIIFLAGIQTNYISQLNRVIMCVLILLSFCVLFVSTLKVSMVDPVDSVMLQYRNGDRKKVEQALDGCLYCQTCNSYVKNSSKHCKLCDRCVDNFDHHCIWINNCIGENNYNWFFVMVIAAFLYMLFFCISVGLIYQQQNWVNYQAVMIISWIQFAIVLPFCLILFILTLFHVNLIRKGLTTYEFIMLKRSEDEQKINLDKPQIHKTNQSINQFIAKNQNHQEGKGGQVTGAIFAKKVDSSEEHSQKMEFKKTNPTNKVSKTQFTQSNEPKQTNQKQMKQFFNRHRSLKFLVGQSLIIQTSQAGKYETVKQRARYTQLRRQKENGYATQKYKQQRLKIQYK